jgi:transposase InsO family protein
MAIRTNLCLRQQFCQRHRCGETYQAIAEREGVSKETVRYWCRRERDGGDLQTVYRREPAGLLARFDPKVRFRLLRLRLEHPRWGPNRLRHKLKKCTSLRGLRLPSEASIGRYLHQWDRFRRCPKPETSRERPNAPTHVHQRWQVDFKLGIALENGRLLNLCTARDPVGEACIGASLFATRRVGRKAAPVTLEQVRSFLRLCFARWRTLPEEIQTDGEALLIGAAEQRFPSVFTLWLQGLGIDHLVIRPGKPTDNAEVERCHRTIHDYAIVGQEKTDHFQLQNLLDQAIDELNGELPSRADGCAGLPPIVAHPELQQPRRLFHPYLELALFDLKRVDTYLATFTWQRQTGRNGQTEVGRYRYSVGRRFACRAVCVRFDPADRHFVFSAADDPRTELCRRPAKGLHIASLTGLATRPLGLGPQQLPLPISEEVNC